MLVSCLSEGASFHPERLSADRFVINLFSPPLLHWPGIWLHLIKVVDVLLAHDVKELDKLFGSANGVVVIFFIQPSPQNFRSSFRILQTQQILEADHMLAIVVADRDTTDMMAYQQNSPV